MSDYYNRETGWDALCRIMAEREAKEKELEEAESEVQND